MSTECNGSQLEFHPLGRREIRAAFDGGRITSDGGGLLLREVEKRTGILRQFAACFTDHRDEELIEHTVGELIAQRVYALALGYEDVNDHDQLRYDPLLAVLVGKHDPLGQKRRSRRDRGKALAGKSTLNRLELTPGDASPESRYKKIVAHEEQIESLFVDLLLQAHPSPPQRIVLDLDATDDPLYGHQEGRFFHGYYREYCYLPLYIFCGDFLLCAKLRTSNIDAAAGALDEVARIVTRIRQAWPDVRILLRGDSGFCREELMAWCEAHEVDFLFGLAKNERLKKILAPQMEEAKARCEETGEPARQFADFSYQTLHSWSRARRVVGKAEHLAKGENPRFVVTSITADQVDARTLYEDHYCARGDMENRIKEQQLALFADRTSTAEMRSNQLRLWFSSIAYALMHAVRRLALSGTSLARAQCDTIRLKLLKIGAAVRISVRRVWISLSESYPFREVFEQALANLAAVPLVPG
jgi:Transposase DDE domain group 1